MIHSYPQHLVGSEEIGSWDGLTNWTRSIIFWRMPTAMNCSTAPQWLCTKVSTSSLSSFFQEVFQKVEKEIGFSLFTRFFFCEDWCEWKQKRTIIHRISRNNTKRREEKHIVRFPTMTPNEWTSANSCQGNIGNRHNTPAASKPTSLPRIFGQIARLAIWLVLGLVGCNMVGLGPTRLLASKVDSFALA